MAVSSTAKPTRIRAHWQTGNWVHLTWAALRQPDHYEYEHDYQQRTPVPEPKTGLFAVPPGGHATCQIRNVACGDPSIWAYVTVDSSGEITKIAYEEEDDPPPPPPPEFPNPVRNLRVSNVGSTSALVSWDEPEAGGAPVLYYHITWNGEGCDPEQDTTTNLSYQLSGLTPDTQYAVAVTAMAANNRASSPRTEFWTTQKDEPVPPPPPPGEFPRSAPFVDAMGWPTPRLRKWFNNWGVQGFFLGFWASRQEPDGYHLTWGGYGSATDKYEPIPDTECTNPSGGVTHSHLVTDSQYLQWLTRDIQAQGGVIIPSVGGANGHPIEQDTLDVESAAQEYAAALDNYNTEFLDFDIEGSALTTAEQRAVHVRVLNRLRQLRPNLKISHTLAIDVDGYNWHTQQLLSEMARQGYVPDMIMGMLMEMRLAPDGSYYTSLQQSAEAMVQHNASTFGWSMEESWKRLGMCPMFGVNNGVVHDSRKVTTVAHMRRMVNELARPHQVATVSGWSANRDYHANNPDQQCEDTPNCPVGPPYPSIYNCTHVEQEHAAFSKLAATYTSQQIRR